MKQTAMQKLLEEVILEREKSISVEFRDALDFVITAIETDYKEMEKHNAPTGDWNRYYEAFKEVDWAVLPVGENTYKKGTYHLFLLRIKEINYKQRNEIIERINNKDAIGLLYYYIANKFNENDKYYDMIKYYILSLKYNNYMAANNLGAHYLINKMYISVV
jgi:dTDP-4-amino-4,6-dideoxygalactose transaminase